MQMQIKKQNAEDVLRELYASTPATITYESAKAVFDRVLSQSYNISYHEINVIKTGKADNICLKCRITIISDDGKDIVYKESYAGMEILYTEDSTPANFSTAIMRCEKEAFKQCCTLFFAPKKKSSQTITKREEVINENGNVFIITLLSGFSQFAGYKNTYSANVKLSDGTSATAVIWYKTAVELDKSGKLDQILNEFGPNNKVKIKGKKEIYKGTNQISIESFL